MDAATVAWLMQPGTPTFTLATFTHRPAWMADAACTGHPVELFFPVRGASTIAAKRICAGCPVRAECLAYALVNPHVQGVWGGTTERERRRLRRGWRG